MTARNVADLYLRVSSDREGHSGIEHQEADCREWAAQNGFAVRKVHVDRGRSAFKPVRRSGFSDAVTAVTAGVVDALVVWKLDRLSRRGIAEVSMHLTEFQKAGARFISVMDHLDTAEKSARDAMALLADLARAESENTSMRVESAKRHLRGAGKWIGGRPPYGLKVDPETRRLVPDAETAVYARLIADEALAGSTLVEIARLLNTHGVESPRGGEWNSSTILQLLRSPAFAGIMPQTEMAVSADGTRKYGHRVHPYIDPVTLMPVHIGEGVIGVEERELILQKIESRTLSFAGSRKVENRSPALLTGLARCGRCGSRMSKAGTSYQCSRHRMGRDCGGVSVQVKSFDHYVEATVRHRVAELRPGDPLMEIVLERMARRSHPELFKKRDVIAEEISALENRRSDLEEARYLRGEFEGEDGLDRYTQIARRQGERLDQLREAAERASLPPMCRPLRPKETLLQMAEGAKAMEERRDLLKLLVDQVEVQPGRVGVRFDGDSRVSIAWAAAGAAAAPLT
ncbi:recombinase family protein [Glycomyces tritici]|uniref:Recombinase family protein n=1 Tax=Glycomyces tritici TaxID=2665176 RepID=A0ABT7YR21_9ACTN|nr:recombinase family protein [Glycomyces tritici]MDN3240844.1 recombinase family protein [Glycomyces tritici]